MYIWLDLVCVTWGLCEKWSEENFRWKLCNLEKNIVVKIRVELVLRYREELICRLVFFWYLCVLCFGLEYKPMYQISLLRVEGLQANQNYDLNLNRWFKSLVAVWNIRDRFTQVRWSYKPIRDEFLFRGDWLATESVGGCWVDKWAYLVLEGFDFICVCHETFNTCWFLWLGTVVSAQWTYIEMLSLM